MIKPLLKGWNSIFLAAAFLLLVASMMFKLKIKTEKPSFMNEKSNYYRLFTRISFFYENHYLYLFIYSRRI